MRVGGSTTELRFLPASVEHVRASALRALPALAARPAKEKDGVIEAKVDGYLLRSAATAEGQAHGTFSIEITPAKYGGVTGALLSIDFSKGWVGAAGSSGRLATPMADEIACLVSLLSPVDPASSPRGQTSVSPPATAREVSVPAKTGIKVALRHYLYSKDFQNGVTSVHVSNAAEPEFEVVEDVAVDGVTVVRKGALAKGKLTGVARAGLAARGGTIALSIDSATAVDGQEIALEGGSVKEQGQIKRSVAQQHTTDALMSGPILGGLMMGLGPEGQEALIPAGTTYNVQVMHPVTVKVEPEPAKPAGSSPASPGTGQQAGAAGTDAPPGLNVEGTWSSSWGEFKLLQAPGEREVIGKGGGYSVDGIVAGTRVILHFKYGGELYYSVDLAPKGDNDILSGQYASGEMRAGAKTKPIEMAKVLNIAAGKNDPPPAVNVDGAWSSHDWGKIELTQAAGEREVAGKRRGYQIYGFVSGTRVILHFVSGGEVYYSAELTPKGDGALSGRYAKGEMLANSKTWPIEMTKEK